MSKSLKKVRLSEDFPQREWQVQKPSCEDVPGVFQGKQGGQPGGEWRERKKGKEELRSEK